MLHSFQTKNKLDIIKKNIFEQIDYFTPDYGDRDIRDILQTNIPHPSKYSTFHIPNSPHPENLASQRSHNLPKTSFDITKLFNQKSWFLRQASGNHILMLLAFIQWSTKKNEEEKGAMYKE